MDHTDWWPFERLQARPADWDRFARGYLRSANLLLDHLRENQDDMELLLFPLSYNYRHYLELRLKQILSALEASGTRTGPLPKSHKLPDLWDEVKRGLTRALPSIDSISLFQAGALLDDFAALDSKGEDYRYPLDTEGRPTLRGVKAVSLVELSQAMMSLSALLEGFALEIGLSHRS